MTNYYLIIIMRRVRILFATRDDETVLQSIDNQIEILPKAN
jgi:hypothetical protein